MKPTKRAVVDIGRKCNLNCRFCYHGHMGDLRKQSFRPLQELKQEVMEAQMRGNEWVDFTGGEPTIYPDMVALLQYAKGLGLKTCIISNIISDKIWDCISFVDDILISVHGVETMHDWVCQHEGARMAQVKTLRELKARGIHFRFNTVINAHNEKALFALVEEFNGYGLMPYIWNFINFNPHYEWGADKAGTQAIIADLDSVMDELAAVIPTLELMGIGVNLRYYPMCKVSEGYRHCVCNDLHVTFDPYEWDYTIYPKTPEKHIEWGIAATKQTESKASPCNVCQLQFICGGANSAFKEALEAKGGSLEPVKPHDSLTGDLYAFYHYRKDNVMALTLEGEVY